MVRSGQARRNIAQAVRCLFPSRGRANHWSEPRRPRLKSHTKTKKKSEQSSVQARQGLSGQGEGYRVKGTGFGGVVKGDKRAWRA